MAGVKLVVMYPRPKDINSFEQLYQKEHVPMAVEKLSGKSKLVATKVVASPQGTPPFYRIAEVHFPTMEALQACAASEGGKKTLEYAVSISSGVGSRSTPVPSRYVRSTKRTCRPDGRNSTATARSSSSSSRRKDSSAPANWVRSSTKLIA